MAFGNPEATDNSDDAFYTAVSKIQREGMARYVEVETDPQGYPEGTYGFYFRAIDEESLRSFNGFMPLLGRLASACYPALNQQAYSDAVTDGLNSGGPYYAIGEGMAQAIDRYAGRNRLVETVSKGPLDFFDCYIGIAHSHNELPQVPTEVVSHIETLRHKYRNGRLPLPVAGASTSFGAATPAHHY
jgi:hypothetical protein